MNTGAAAPYARIAAELRARIIRGELAPGDWLPSTREIVRQFDVAIATATRALAVLRDEGLAQPVRGVGTVVRAPARRRAEKAPAVGPRPARRSPDPLSRDRIVAAAIEVADAEGLDAVSMRRVATQLGAAPMSLYRHVATKDDLLMQMMDAVVRASWRPPAEPPAGWRPRLELAHRALWRMFKRHPWLAPAMSVTRPQPIPAGLEVTEWILDALDGCGLEPREALDVHVVLFTFVRGTAIALEPERAAEAATGLTSEDWLDTQTEALTRIVDAGRFPRFRRLVELGYDLDLDAIVEQGLARLLDGLEVAFRR